MIDLGDLVDSLGWRERKAVDGEGMDARSRWKAFEAYKATDELCCVLLILIKIYKVAIVVGRKGGDGSGIFFVLVNFILFFCLSRLLLCFLLYELLGCF